MSTKTDGGLKNRARFIAIIIVFSTIILSVAVPAARAAEQILVATNKYVILDDPIIKGLNGTGFADPKYSYSAWNYWNGIGKNASTEINATALYLDNNGTPVQGINITFRLYYPNGSINTTKYGITNSMGLADVSIDLNNASFYGKWNLSAANGSQSANTTFIYNWWGCAYNAGQCSRNHATNYPTAAGAAPVNSPYLSGRDTTVNSRNTHYNASAVNCTFCHQSYDGKPGDTNPPVAGGVDANHLNRTADVHRNVVGGCANSSCHNSLAIHQTNALIASCFNATGGCHVSRADISNKSTLNSSNVATALSLYSINSTSFNATFHTPNSTVPCIICHGPMHNITKPDETQRFIRNNNTESSQCTECHTSYSKHNNTVNCTVCHSDDVHDIQVFAQNGTYVDLNHDSPNQARGNCTNCHQNASFLLDLTNLTKNPKAGYHDNISFPAPQIPKPLNHSNDISAGRKWNQTPGYWINGTSGTAQNSSCRYCHGETMHKTSALGRPSLFNGNNAVGATISSTLMWCQQCHWQGASNYSSMISTIEGDSKLVPPEITGNATYGANQSNPAYFSHTGVSKDDSSCDGCHGSLATGTNITYFMHNVAIGSGGGPDCLSCHDYGKTGAGHRINNSAMNSSSAIHANLNKNAANSSWVSAENKKCWGCHDSNGSQPANDSMGSRYNNPYKCYDCHNATGKPYANVSNALNVSEHFKNGDEINAATSAADNSSSCAICHNLSEMKGTYTEDDAYNSNYSLASHYGRNRTFDPQVRQGNSTNCSYCHQNASTVFATAMVSVSNNSIANHSTLYPSTNPDCTDCHKTGWLHNSSLTRPVLTLPNSSLCLSCHGTPGGANATIKNFEQHNNALNCTDCHLNTSRSIHPVRYLKQDGTNWSTAKTGAVNCTTCHQGSGLNNFSSAPIIPTPMNHSTNPYNGSLWNSTPGYWTNTSQQSACNYCHNNSALHNTSGLGNITKVQAGNSKNQSLAGGYWCANCHYKNAPDYGGNQFSPQPPEVLNQDGLVPEISGDGTAFYNHSSAVSSSYDDATCKGCHDNKLNAGATSLNFSHNLGIGQAGGANCTNCHNTGGSAGAGKLVNISAMNYTNAIHSNLNSGATTALPEENKKCWACHGNGSEPSGGHPSTYKTPYKCPDCHVSGVGQNLNFTPKNTILNVTQHYWNGTNITTSGVTSCYSCHNRTEMMLGTNIDPDGAAGVYGGENGGNNSSSHYGKKRNDMASMDNYTYCSYCHNTTTNNATFYVSDYNNTIYNHTFRDTTPLCGNCHNTGRIHNSTLVKPVSNDTLCKTCHGTGGSAITNNKTEHKTLYCTECHANSSTGTLAGKDIHGIKYLTQSNSFSSYNSSAVNCTTCHQENIVDLSLTGFTPFKIATPLHHGDNANNGSVWGNYWINTTLQTACIYCHGDTKHNSTPVGRTLQWEQDYRLFGSINTNTTCASCHYRGDSNYTQMNSSLASAGLATPPEITNDTNWMGTSANYYNHSLDSYADQNCKTCHGSLLSAQTNMSEFMHTIATGVAGGADCVSCHNISGNGAPGDRRINASSLKLSAHKNINANAINTSVLDPINKACWACHGNGTQPDKHPVNYLYPKPCEYCHVNNNFNATPVYQHYPGSVFSGSIVYDNFDPNRTCVSCHNNSLVANQNITYGGYAAEKLKNASVSHYVVNRTSGESMPSAVRGILPNTRATTGTNFGCNKCHNTGAVGKDYGNARILPSSHNKMGSTGISCQSSCHNSNPQVNLTLHDKNIGIYVGSNGCFSSGCHIQPSTGGRRKR